MQNYFCNAWLIGHYIVKSSVYYPACKSAGDHWHHVVEKVPATLVMTALSACRCIFGCQRCYLRLLVINFSIASVCAVVAVMTDRLTARTAATPLSVGAGGKERPVRWHNTEQAVSFSTQSAHPKSYWQCTWRSATWLTSTAPYSWKFATQALSRRGSGRASGFMLMQTVRKFWQPWRRISTVTIESILNSSFDMVMLTDDTQGFTGEEKSRRRWYEVNSSARRKCARQPSSSRSPPTHRHEHHQLKGRVEKSFSGH